MEHFIKSFLYDYQGRESLKHENFNDLLLADIDTKAFQNGVYP